MTKALFVLAVVTLLAACGNTKPKVASDAKPEPVSTNPQAQDLSKMPILDAIKAKYSRLQLVCVTDDQEPLGKFGTTSSTSGRRVAWDLLTDPSQDKTISFTEKTGLQQWEYTLTVTLSLNTGTYTGAKQVEMKDAATLTGQFNGQVNVYDKDGKLQTTTLDKGPASLFESLPLDLRNGAMGDYKLKITCTLEGDVKSAYVSDTTTASQ